MDNDGSNELYSTSSLLDDNKKYTHQSVKLEDTGELKRTSRKFQYDYILVSKGLWCLKPDVSIVHDGIDVPFDHFPVIVDLDTTSAKVGTCTGLQLSANRQTSLSMVSRQGDIATESPIPMKSIQPIIEQPAAVGGRRLLVPSTFYAGLDKSLEYARIESQGHVLRSIRNYPINWDFGNNRTIAFSFSGSLSINIPALSPTSESNFLSPDAGDPSSLWDRIQGSESQGAIQKLLDLRKPDFSGTYQVLASAEVSNIEISLGNKHSSSLATQVCNSHLTILC